MTPDVVTVAVTRVDGGLTVLRIITAEYQMVDGVRTRTAYYEPTPEYVESILAKYVGGDKPVWHPGNGKVPASWRFVPNDFAETTDRTYRNAWKDGNGKPDHDMPKARNIHRDKLRKSRANVLEALDVDYMLADEARDQKRKDEIAARKQKLRDVTDDLRIEQAQTVDELKTLTLEALTA